MTAVLLTLLLAFSPIVAPFAGDEIDEAIASLEKALKEKSKPDIKHFVSALGEKFASAKPPQQKEILRLDGVVLGLPEQELKDAAVEAVGRTNAEGVPLLIKELDKKTTEENPGYQANVIKAIGRLKDPKAGLDRLLKLLKNKSIDVVATATDALANYKDAPFETKKNIFDEIIKIYSSVHSAANSSSGQRDTTAKNKLTRLGPSADETLRNLTGQQVKGAPEWLKWWNDTGKKATKW
jgi:HEAT repeat protein